MTAPAGAAPGPMADAGKDDGPTVAGVPSPTMPKGGGAIRGLGESYEVNAANGTLSLTIPIATSPARGLEPSLMLRHDSGGGNSPYGQGWDVSLGSVSRRTDRMLPRYHDDDVIVVDGEDLVPATGPNAGPWVAGQRTEGAFTIQCYRPRVEAAYDRVERWTRTDGDQHWVIRTKDGRTHVYGEQAAARIADPADARRVYRWLRERTYDDHGNLIVYAYRAEDRSGVAPSIWEQDRAPADTLIDRIHYGVTSPYDPTGPLPTEFLFEIVFDYGERAAVAGEPPYAPPAVWTVRADPFSTGKPGFDLRCYRLCRRILLFHHIAELGADPVLVRETRLRYLADPSLTKLAGVTALGWRDGTALTYPEVTFDYTVAAVDPTVHELDADSVANLPPPVTRWVDLDGEGIPGALVDAGPGWFYKRSLGGGRLDTAELLPTRPSAQLAGGGQLVDVAGSGVKSLVHFGGPVPGQYARTEDFAWAPFTPFATAPAVAFDDPNMRLIDLDGDGLLDALVTEAEILRWYPSLGFDGFGAALLTPKGPDLVFDDGERAVYLADMTGDGLTDLVRIRSGQVCYWPNLGHGRFGAQITMGGAPTFTDIRPGDIRLADIDGSGTTDLLYCDGDRIRYWLNQAGNFFGPESAVAGLPVDPFAQLDAIDLLGDGTSCLVWSSTLPSVAQQPVRYVALTGGIKPHLLTRMDNGLGHVMTAVFASSTTFYLADRAAGRPWVTRIPFPVQVVAEITSTDQVGGHSLTSTYAYHHGFFDGVEREFRGFGAVDRRDSLSLAALQSRGLFPADVDYVPPSLTRTWFHTGAYLDAGRLTDRFRTEWFALDPAHVLLTDPPMPAGLDPGEHREALRALRGKVLRTEVYADGEPIPYRVEERTYPLRRIQPRGPRRHAVFAADPGEHLTYHYERDAADPRVEHEIVLRVGAYGIVEQTATIGYPRRPTTAGTLITYTEHDVVARDAEAAAYRINVATGTRRYEVTGLTPPVAGVFTPGQLAGVPALVELPFTAVPAPGLPQRRLLGRSQVRYYADDDVTIAPVGTVGARALLAEVRHAVMPATMPGTMLAPAVDATLLADGGYVSHDGLRWSPSATTAYAPAAFFQATRHTDPFGQVSTVAFDPHELLPVIVTNPLGQTISVELDYHALKPARITDVNGNATLAAYDAFGQVTDIARTGKAGEGDTLAASTNHYGYALTEWRDNGRPNYSYARRRVEYRANVFQETYIYTDGFGRELMTKLKADPGTAITVVDSVVTSVDTADRWIATGRTGYDNKGNAVRKYEPFFTVGSAYDPDPLLHYLGAAAVLHYDPVGRLIRTDVPDGTFTTVVIGAWEQIDADGNDTVDGSRWTVRAGLSAADQRAVDAARTHRSTPTRRMHDALGRVTSTFADNTVQAPAVDTPDGSHIRYETRLVLDVEGRTLQTFDDRGLHAGVPYATSTTAYDMTGRPLRVIGAETGTSYTLPDVTGKPLYRRDGRGVEHVHHYDVLRRQIRVDVTDATTWTSERTVYGDDPAVPADPAANRIGRVYQQFDQAGIVTTARYDFAGNPLTEARQLIDAYAGPADWTATHLDPLVTTREYDALDRVTRTVLPRRDPGAGTDNVSIRTYLPQALLGSVTQTTQYGGAPSASVAITYDAKGRRAAATYGNGVVRTYAYDPLTLRLAGVTTVRGGTQTLQDVTMTYDAVGNITEITDVAQATVFNRAAQIEPRLAYTYDSIYRLAAATGREMHDQAQAADPDPAFGGWSPDANDLVNYRETYGYDSVGNLLDLVHTSNNGTQTWHRHYGYAVSSNLLIGTSVPGAPDPNVLAAAYGYDTGGDMIAMAHLTSLTWDSEGRLESAQRLDGGFVHNRYDANGQRIRKLVTHRAADGTQVPMSERIYIGDYEVFRRLDSSPQEVESVHVQDAIGRYALIETDTSVPSPAPAIRYQLDNHLGSAVLELDQHAALLSYEEYHPFGTTAYHTSSSMAEVSRKRYRFLGRERDDETGFYYCQSRHYCAWLGRWINPDPKGIAGGLNLYVYSMNSPIVARDPGGQDPLVTPTAPAAPASTTPASTAPASTAPADPVAAAPTGLPDRAAGPAGSGSGSATDADCGSMNMENLSNGNTAGGATKCRADEAEVGGTRNVGSRNPNSTVGTYQIASRFGIFRGAEAGILYGGPLFSYGTGAPPSFMVGTLHLTDPNEHLGLYLQGGVSRDPSSGQSTPVAGMNIAGSGTVGAHDNVSIYGNGIINGAGTGSVSGVNTDTTVGFTALGGVQGGPAVLGSDGKYSTPNVFGAEASITGTVGYGTGTGPMTSTTVTGLAFYQRSIGPVVFGVALGVSHESGGGGTTGFLRFGVGIDHAPYPPLNPDLQPFH